MYKVPDISYYQIPVNFNYDIFANSIDGCIVRGGWTGWGTGVDKHKDDSAEQHYAELKKRGVPVGSYYYSCAITSEQAKAEALFFHDKFLKGKQFELPIYVDIEDFKRQQFLDRQQLTNVINSFCQTLENLGYYAGIYSSSYWFRDLMFADKLPYTKWVAHWGVNRPLYTDYDAWQYTGNGRIDGYPYQIDLSYFYQDFPTIIKQNKLNGFSQKIDPPLERNKEAIHLMAIDVINGLYGKGDNRKFELYNAIQSEVNDILLTK